MIQPLSKAALPSLILALVALAGCGGGSSGASSDSVDTEEPVSPVEPDPQPETVAGSMFVERAAEVGIQFVKGYRENTLTMPEKFGGGVAAGDYDGDGDTDFFIVRGDIGPNLLYQNDGSGQFVEVAAEAGVAETNPDGGAYRHSGPTFADMDGDGDLDLFVGGLSGDPNIVFQNNGDGTYSDVSAGSGLANLKADDTISAGFGDYDLDGDLDLALSHWGTHRPKPASDTEQRDTETLWRNDSAEGVIRFTNVSVVSRVSEHIMTGVSGWPAIGPDYLNYDYTFVETFARINDDLYPDLLSVADFNNTRLLLNRGDASDPATFVDATDEAVIVDENGMGSAVGDLDNDGDLDWFVSSIFGENQPLGNRLYQNLGEGRFVDATPDSGVMSGGWGWGACVADFNLDGNLDIFQTNGWDGQAFVDHQSRLFIGLGDMVFEDQATQLGLIETAQGRGVVCGDFDRDGDVDVFLTHTGADNSASYWENRQEGGNSLVIDLRGAGLNSEAAGARLWVVTGNLSQMREITIGSNFTSQNPTEQIFGLGEALMADEVRIEWPDGRIERHTAVESGRVVYRQDGS